MLAEIDVAATLRKKLRKDMPPYKILGACNPLTEADLASIAAQLAPAGQPPALPKAA